MTMHIPLLYIPTFCGDIRLEAEGQHTRVIVEEATPLERKALRALIEHGVKVGWTADGNEITTRVASTDKEYRFLLETPLLKVSKKLTSLLKPSAQMVTVVRFKNGVMEEVVEAPLPATSPRATGASGPPAMPNRKDDATPEPEKGVKAATAVAKPTQGCPAPAFNRADIRANRVLETFLDEEQIEDFRAYNRFVTIGALTGHRLMVTSRYATDSLSKYHRSLYDLDTEQPLCVHNWDVPPAEEMLSLHLMASLPQHENFLRQISEPMA